MKRMSLLVSMLMLVAVNVANADNTQENNSATVGITDPTRELEPFSLHPHRIPTFILNGNILNFNTPCYDCAIVIIDTENHIVYYDVIPKGAKEYVLPFYPTDEYPVSIIGLRETDI